MNDAPKLIAALREQMVTMPVTELPPILGQIAALDAEMRVRIALHPPVESRASRDTDDDWLTEGEAAEFLNQTARWVRDHSFELGASKLPGRAGRLYSRRKLNLFLKRRVG